MGNGQHFAADILFVIFHPFPKFFRVFAYPGIKGHHLIGIAFATAIQDITMQIVATGNRRPFIANHRREYSGVVKIFSRLGIGLPN